jgi:hypothetical protein
MKRLSSVVMKKYQLLLALQIILFAPLIVYGSEGFYKPNELPLKPLAMKTILAATVHIAKGSNAPHCTGTLISLECGHKTGVQHREEATMAG